MTSAWKLFYAWKSRGGRSSDTAEDPPLDSDLRRPRCRHGRGAREDPDPLPGSHSRNLCRRRASLSELEAIRMERRTGDLESTNGNGGVSIGVADRVRLIRGNQLPDAVIQARERLIARLRSVSLAGSRESATSSGFTGDESELSHDVRISNVADRIEETLTDWFNSNLHLVDFTLNESKKKHSGVHWETLRTLHLEVFRNADEVGESRVWLECCICLESFCEGDGLIRLHCGHRFHPACLEPWVRTCSDCPYCRAIIKF